MRASGNPSHPTVQTPSQAPGSGTRHQPFPRWRAGTHAARQSLDRGFRRHRRPSRPAGGLACVIGDMDLVRPLGLAGIALRRRGPTEAGRALLPLHPSRCRVGGSLEASRRSCSSGSCGSELLSRSSRPCFIRATGSSCSSRAAASFLEAPSGWSFPKRSSSRTCSTRFASRRSAERLALPVPESRRVTPGRGGAHGISTCRFPVIVKPVTRQMATWAPTAGRAKALRANSPAGAGCDLAALRGWEAWI